MKWPPPSALIATGALLAYILILLFNPIRTSLRDGLRCIRRYPSTWGILAMLGFFYAAFQLALRVFYFFALPENARPIFQWGRAWFLPRVSQTGILKESVLPGIESDAGVFNNIVTTYPLSAIAAILFLVNWEGHHAVLNRAVRRRFGGFGWIVYFGILLCAFAAIAKPVLYASLPTLNRAVSGLLLLQLSSVIDWLSFLFEYMLGILIQIYLILLVYVWVRAVHFTRSHLIDFAIRRFSYVMKWASIVMLLSTLFIHLPLIFLNFAPFTNLLPERGVFAFIDRVARPLIAVFLILFSSVQITLTFHSESLRKAFRDHFAFVKRHAWPVSWFILLAGFHFVLVNFLNLAIERGMGEGTAATLIWRLAFPLVAAAVAAWMLATWVCLFKRLETGHTAGQDWIRF
ncbi:MAG: hypothetical protein M3O82_03890 [Verrucomicrobiota bacterium]|nr:hypothetical protein [Verrucomicrobiota bacterium]